MLLDHGLLDDFSRNLLAHLDECFSHDRLETETRYLREHYRGRLDNPDATADALLAIARRNYEIRYDADTRLDERIVFPHSPSEANGIEDARFVYFDDDREESRYIATYKAWDGRSLWPQLQETADFAHFRLRTLGGPQAQNNAMALFPRRIGGRYAMLSRQDNENLFVVFSDNLYLWHERALLVQPTHPWEFIRLGNCGAPLETPEGWLVLTHGIGPMRKYTIGAILLGLERPEEVIGRLREPLLTPNDNEREGYVPNVVYSCGAIIHGGRLLIPDAMADYATTFATVELQPLLHALRTAGP